MEKDKSIRSADLDTGFFDVNTVSEQDVANIPGVGPEYARQLIEHRPYESMEQLQSATGLPQDIIDELLRAGAMAGKAEPIGAGKSG